MCRGLLGGALAPDELDRERIFASSAVSVPHKGVDWGGVWLVRLTRDKRIVCLLSLCLVRPLCCLLDKRQEKPAWPLPLGSSQFRQK